MPRSLLRRPSRALRLSALLGLAAPVAAQGPDTSWVSRSVLYEVFVQDFSPAGTFAGVTANLDRVVSAGANTVWIMPVHPIGVKERKGTLGSPYAAQDFRGINPAYGTAADFRALVDGAHARGLKVILDWVPDHTAQDHPWITEHPDWYFQDDHGRPQVPRDPDGNLTDWTDVAQLDYGNPALRQEMIATMQWWLDEFGLDGFRVDVAGFLPYDFFAEAIPALRAAVSRRLLFLAEWGDPEIHRSGFDLTYAWDTHNRLKEAWKGAPASTLVRKEMLDLLRMPPGALRMRFTTNHDMTAWDDPPGAIFGEWAGARAAFVAMALLPGRPLLYNGQEVESPQKLGLFEREAIAWDQPHADEARAFYQKMVQLTIEEADLRGVDLAEVSTNAGDDVIAYRRGNIVVLVNIRPRPLRVKVERTRIDGASDLLSTRQQKGDTVTLPAFGAVALKGKGR